MEMIKQAKCPECGALMELMPTRNELFVFGTCPSCGHLGLLEDPRLQDPSFALEMRRRGQRQVEIDFKRQAAGLPLEKSYDIFRDELAADGPYGNIVKVDFKGEK